MVNLKLNSFMLLSNDFCSIFFCQIVYFSRHFVVRTFHFRNSYWNQKKYGRTHTHSHTLRHANTHSHTLTHAHTCSHTLTHAHTCSHALTHAHTRSHMLTHAHTHFKWERERWKLKVNAPLVLYFHTQHLIVEN